MNKATTVLLMLCVAALAIASPAAADDPEDDEIRAGPCVTVYLDPPGVIVDPWCILPEDFPPW